MQLAQSFYTLLVFALFLPWTLMVQLLIMLIVSSGLNITSSMSNEWIKLSDWSCWNMNALGFHNTIFIDQVLRKKVIGGWDPTCTKRSFFPFWRSVLGSRGNVRVYPSYAAPDENMVLDVELLRKRMSNWSSPMNHVGLTGQVLTNQEGTVQPHSKHLWKC